ncbi:MAG: C2 family cysteine protease [Vulcanimicrobiota bacterium]
MKITHLAGPKPGGPLRRFRSPAEAPNLAFDQVSLSQTSPGRWRARPNLVGLAVALALAALPAASAIVPHQPDPVAHVVPNDSWVAGVPGRDVVETRLEGIDFSLRQGHLTATQANRLRQMLRELPPSGGELVNRLAAFDNLYDHYRLPAEPPASKSAQAQPVPASPDANTVWMIRQGFHRYDRDHDQSLTRGELTRGMSGSHGSVAAAMGAMFGDLARSGQIAYEPLMESLHFQGAGSTLVRLTEVTLQRQANQSPLVPLAQESFDSSRIRQHFQGSCVLLSTLLELPPQYLRQMISDNHDGTYTVHFRNGREATVSEPSSAERAFFSNTLEGERWPAIFEKAVGAVRAQDGVGGGDLVEAGHTIPPTEAIALMTGRTGEFRHMVALGPSGLRQFLIEAQRRHEPIIAGISRADGNTGLIGHHEYAVKGFDERTNMVLVRNPHASGVWKGSRINQNGLFEMPLSEFYNYFHNITAVRD